MIEFAEFSQQTKAERFDELMAFIQCSLNDLDAGERVKDFEHYVFETAIEICLSKDPADDASNAEMWTWYNDFMEGKSIE